MMKIYLLAVVGEEWSGERVAAMQSGGDLREEIVIKFSNQIAKTLLPALVCMQRKVALLFIPPTPV